MTLARWSGEGVPVAARPTRVRLCAVVSATGACAREGYLDKSKARRERLCVAHASRRARFGDPRARRCVSCRRVVRDRLTGHVVRSGSWTCVRCLGADGAKPALVEERALELLKALARIPRRARLRRVARVVNELLEGT